MAFPDLVRRPGGVQWCEAVGVPANGVQVVTLGQAARVAATSFTIASSAGAADAGVVVYYQLWEPATP